MNIRASNIARIGLKYDAIMMQMWCHNDVNMMQIWCKYDDTNMILMWCKYDANMMM